MYRLSWIIVFWCLCTTLFAQELFTPNKIQTVKIQFKEKNWDKLLDSFKHKSLDDRLLATVWLDGKKYEDCGVAYKGNSSYFNIRSQGLKKLPFSIKANHTHKHQLFPGNISTLKFSNVFRDPSFMREIISYDAARNYMPASRCNFVKIYVNDIYYGLYNNSESVDERFLQKQFSNNTGTFAKCDPDWQKADPKGCPPNEKASLFFQSNDSLCLEPLYEMQSKNGGYRQLMRLISVLNQKPDSIASILDIDETLWYLAFCNVFVNLDSYIGKFSHNFYLYQDTFGIFHPIIWDLNLSLGGFRYDGNIVTPLTLEQMQSMSPLLHSQNKLRPLMMQLLLNAKYKKRYLAFYKTIWKENFEKGTILDRVKYYKPLIEKEIEKDTMKFYPFDTFNTNLEKSAKAGSVSIVGLKELIDGRNQYLSNHPLIGKFDSPKIDSIQTEVVNRKVKIRAKCSSILEMEVQVRFQPNAPIQTFPLYDDGKHNDGGVGDGIWGTEIDWTGDVFHYYLVAYNEKTATCEPARGMNEPRQLK